MASATLCPSIYPHGSPWRTEGRWRYLNGCQNRGTHRPWFLPEKPLCRSRPVGTREEEVMNRGQTFPLSGMIEASKLVIPQREVPVAPFHIGAGALQHLYALGGFCLELVVLNCAQLPQRSTRLT